MRLPSSSTRRAYRCDDDRARRLNPKGQHLLLLRLDDREIQSGILFDSRTRRGDQVNPFSKRATQVSQRLEFGIDADPGSEVRYGGGESEFGSE
jgi:hypothetical protein